MIFDSVRLQKDSKIPLYRQLYEAFRTAVESGVLPYGTKLPSIRGLSEDLHISRTTVETAYQQLCVEGYIESVPQSGYYVQAHIKRPKRSTDTAGSALSHKKSMPLYSYNLGSDCIDCTATDLKLWRTYIKSALKQEEQLTSYGDPQGEKILREELAIYAGGARGLHASTDNIVIGAGTQPLLYLLCGIISCFGKQLSLGSGSFSRAERVFEDCGYSIDRGDDEDEDFVKELYDSSTHLVFVNPSGNLKTGQPMRMNRRIELLDWAQSTGGMIIEDDYNGELRYTSHPIPALQASDDRHVVYIGSFSKLLLPSVRIGYMVLPDILMEIYSSRISSYNQTASKIEQTALAEYIHDGRLEGRLRRLRRLYSEKCTVLTKCLHEKFAENIDIVLHETSLSMTVKLKNTSKNLYEAALEYGVRVSKTSCNTGENAVRLGFAGIPLEDIPKSVDKLADAWGRYST